MTIDEPQDAPAPAGDPVTGRPLLRVVSGSPEPEEIAALVAVVAALGGAPQGEEQEPLSHWSQAARMHRQPAHAGPPGTWWASGLPR